MDVIVTDSLSCAQAAVGLYPDDTVEALYLKVTEELSLGRDTFELLFEGEPLVCSETPVADTALEDGTNLVAAPSRKATAMYLLGEKGVPAIADSYMEAITTGASEVIKLLVDANVPMESPRTLIASAVVTRANAEEVVSEVIRGGADPNAEDFDGIGPLHVVVRYFPPRLEVAKVLLTHGADINLQDDRGETPLHYAVKLRTSALEVVEFCLSYCASVSVADNNGAAPLHKAVRNTTSDVVPVVSLLLKSGADASVVRVDDGYTPLYLAVAHEEYSVQLCKTLIQGNAKVDSEVEGGWTPLISAVSQHHGDAADVTKLLLDSGANLCNPTTEGHTALHEAAGNESLVAKAIMDTLLSQPPDTIKLASAPSSFGDTPLTRSLLNQGPFATAITQALIDAGADVNEPNEFDGNTPLHIAMFQSRSNSKEVMSLLLRAGANDKALNADGLTPYQYSESEHLRYVLRRQLESLS